MKSNKLHYFTEEDFDAVWPYHAVYFLQILNGEYSVEEARADLLGLIGSKYDPRTPEQEQEES